CVGCHGMDGTSVSGIDLGHGRFRHVSSDEDLVKVIMNGVPGTGMPATSMSAARAYTVVAFIRNMSDPPGWKSIAAKSGSVDRGKALFEKNGCAGCHRIRGEGGRSGPDLTEAGLTLRSIEIERVILDPEADDLMRPFRVVRKDGTAVSGLLLNQDTFTVQMQD